MPSENTAFNEIDKEYKLMDAEDVAALCFGTCSRCTNCSAADSENSNEHLTKRVSSVPLYCADSTDQFTFLQKLRSIAGLDKKDDVPNHNDLNTWSENEELKDQLDFHSMIAFTDSLEPMLTAEEIISEIESMVQEEDSLYNFSNCEFSDSGVHLDDTFEYLNSSLLTSASSSSDQFKYYSADDLKRLSLVSLNDLLDGLSCCAAYFSDNLVTELKVRDELQYENELKKTFVDLVLSIQSRRADYEEELLTDRNFPSHKQQSSGTFLTTLVPYDPKSLPHSLYNIQIINKLLKAIDSNDAAVPKLITDYILRVLCPST